MLFESSKISVIVNGSPTNEFSPNRGLRQGDPLSPLLFNLVGEVLSKLLNEVNKRKIFNIINLLGCGMELTHIQYADDVILFIDNEETSIKGIKQVLQCFELLSGLHINFNKSYLFGFGDDHRSIAKWASILGCQTGKDNLTYLGTEMGISPASVKYWDPMIHKLKSRLQEWNTDYISMAGGLVLLKASLDSLPIFWFNLFRIPLTALEKMEQIRRNFLWGHALHKKKKLHLLSWDSICSPKDKGGLGLTKLKNRNLALIAKWWWQAYEEKSAWWNNFLSQRYGKE